MSHTPDHIHNPTCACTCYIEHNGKAEHIVYCPKHAAAPELLEACRAAFQRSCDRLNTHPQGWTAGDQQVHVALREAIDKAQRGGGYILVLRAAGSVAGDGWGRASSRPRPPSNTQEDSMTTSRYPRATITEIRCEGRPSEWSVHVTPARGAPATMIPCESEKHAEEVKHAIERRTA